MKVFFLHKGKIHIKMCLGVLLYFYANRILIMQYITFINLSAMNGIFKVEDKVDLSQ